ncbi:TPA: DUF1631 family protein [Pseudomonas aeruginosa]|nr:DUF1631 family protein [Pseudomonas aeruginosa]
MQNDANVVHLTRVASEPSPNAGAGRLPVILVQVRDKAALQLKQALQALFDNADDTLFEMADRATSNLEQNAFFEAMRDLRLKRKSIERVYLQKVFEEFSALNQVQSGKSVPTLDTVSFDSLSLVQNEELEESVAVDAMVARVMSRDATALAHLSTRLNTLVGRKVDEKSNPLAPRPLTAAFLDACQGLGVEIKVKLIILKLFEKYVLAHCDQLYAEANQILVAAGVLPELKSALPRRQPAVRPEAVRDAGTLQAQAALLDGGQQEVFGALQELLAQVRDNPSFYRRETPENAAPISSNDLMIFERLKEEDGIVLKMINMGGGFPANYITKTNDLETYAEEIIRFLKEDFGDDLPEIILEPGRSLIANAGILVSEVVLVARKSRTAVERWVYADVGKFSGLIETMDESIKFPIWTEKQGEMEEVVIAGPTCDSADIMYEHYKYGLPLNLASGDRLYWLSTGAYTTSYSAVEFNGFPPLKAFYL